MGITADLRSPLLSLKGPSISVSRSVIVVRASVHALLPIDMKPFKDPWRAKKGCRFGVAKGVQTVLQAIQL